MGIPEDFQTWVALIAYLGIISFLILIIIHEIWKLAKVKKEYYRMKEEYEKLLKKLLQNK